MKISLIFTFITVMNATASIYSQSEKISLTMKDVTVTDVLSTIEQNSKFKFFYQNEQIDGSRTVSVKAKEAKIDDVLDQVFDKKEVKVQVLDDNLVVLTKVKLQQMQISGSITSATNNETLPGVNVIEKGTTNGAITDLNGKFTITLQNEKPVLIFSYIGFITQEITIETQTEINVVLVEDFTELEEIVVVGYGSVKRSDITGSIGSIDAEALVAKGATGVLESMQGAIAGVNITKSSARAGGGYNIQIRGQNTLNKEANPPLYVVDGIVTDDIDFLNPSDIVNIDILKDASSTAIYGSRGSNGVVMVTTKNAEKVKEGKTIVSYDGFVGIKTPSRMPEAYTGRQWFEYRSHAYLQWKPGEGDNGMEDWSMVLTGPYMANPEAARRAYAQEDTDWIGAATQNGIQQNHYFNVAGNTGKMSFNMGMGYQEEDGVWIKENLKRNNLKISLNYKISEKLQVGATANLSQTVIESGNNNAYTQIMRMAPIFKIYDEEGEILIQPGLAANMGGVGNNFTGNKSPIWEIENGSNNTRRQDVLASAYLQFSPIKGLDFRTVVQPMFKKSRTGEYTEMVNALTERTGLSKNTELFDYTWDNILSYQKSFNKHNFKVTAIHSVFSSRIESLEVKTQNLSYNSEWYNLFSGSLMKNDSKSKYEEVKMVSYLGRLNYDFAGKYLVTASLRYDGSSKLADKWATFPSAAVAWRISEESFMQADFLSSLKLRFSYGKSGNNNGVKSFATFMGPQYNSIVYYNYGSNAVSGFSPGLPVNPALTWESTRELNLGLDYGFFRGRINGSVELYDRLSDLLLMERKLAIESGVEKMNDNIGSVSNKGVEVALNTVNIQKKNFTWSTNFTFAKNTNEIVTLYGRTEDVVGEKRFIGESINSIYDYKFNGVFSKAEADAASGNALFTNYNPNPGHAKVVDTDGDGAITAADKTILGNTDPKWIVGFSTSMKYKNFDFNLSLIANYGRFVRDEFAANGTGRGKRSQMMWADPEDYYYPQGAPRPDWDNPIRDASGNITGIGYKPAAQENVNAKFPAYKGTEGPYYSDEAMNYMEVSYVKIKNISLGYSLSNDVLAKIGLSKVKFYINVLDPFVFSDYEGWDPEYATTTTKDGNGPASIIYQFGINLQF